MKNEITEKKAKCENCLHFIVCCSLRRIIGDKSTREHACAAFFEESDRYVKLPEGVAGKLYYLDAKGKPHQLYTAPASVE